MAMRVILHIPGEEAILCEIADVPNPTDIYLTVFNPRRKDGKPIPTMDEAATSVIYPWSRIAYVEMFEDRSQRESVVGFFRESDSLRRG
jgi:hypothetical protein